MDTLHMARAGVQYGPFTEDKARQLIAERRLVGSDLVWFAGMPTWQPASEVLGRWFPVAVPAPPPLPALTPPPIPQSANAAPTTPTLSTAQTLSARPAHSTVTSPATASAKAWTKPLESLKGVIGADKLLDPKTLTDVFTQTFRPAEGGQPVAEQAHGNDQDHDDGDDDDHDGNDQQDSWNIQR